VQRSGVSNEFQPALCHCDGHLFGDGEVYCYHLNDCFVENALYTMPLNSAELLICNRHSLCSLLGIGRLQPRLVNCEDDCDCDYVHIINLVYSESVIFPTSQVMHHQSTAGGQTPPFAPHVNGCDCGCGCPEDSIETGNCDVS
jgi:hypothetical protein